MPFSITKFHRPVRLGLYAILVVAASGSIADAAPPVSLDELRSGVKSQYESMRSLYVSYLETRPASQGGATNQHVWAQQGTHTLLRSAATDKEIGYWMSYDGTKAYHVGYDGDHKPSQLELRDNAPDLGLACHFTKLLGWHLGQGELSVSDALAGDVEIRDATDAATCVVDVRNFVSKPNPTAINLTIEFDASHDYLPRRIAFSDVKNPTWKFTHEVEEFGRVKDAGSGQERWFPMKGKYVQETPKRGIEEFPLVVTEVKINANLPSTVFVPEVPDGTPVLEFNETGHTSYLYEKRVPAVRLSLDELRAAVADQYSSMRSLQVAHTFTRPKSAGGQTDRHVWAQQDRRVLFRTEYTDETVGYWLSYDGTRSYNLGYDNDRKPAQVDLKDTPPDLGITCYFTKLLGWHIGQGESSVADALAGDVKIMDLNDADIYGVEVRNFVSRPNPTALNVTFELDSRHDYLPRRIDFSDVDNPAWTFSYQVDEFQRVADSATGGQRWFPGKGKYIQRTPHRGIEEFPIVVTDVKVNETLDDSVFIPEMPKGLSVLDNTGKGRGKFYVVGGYSSADEHVNRMTAEAMDELANQNSTRFLTINAGIVLLIVTCAVVSRWRRQGTS